MSNGNDTIRKVLEVEDKFSRPMGDFKDGLKGIAKESDRADDKVEDFNDAVEDTGKASKKTSEMLKIMAKSTGGAIIAVSGLATLTTRYIISQSELAREIGRVAKNSDIANEAVSGIATTFITVGGDIDMASDFIQDFTERLGDAKEGSGALQESFSSLGVDISGTTEDALRQTISTLGTMEDRQTALFRGIELFGDTYKTVAEEIRKDGDIMSDGVFSDSAIENSERLQENIGEIKREFLKTKNEGIEPLIDSLANLSKWFLDSGAIDYFTDYLEDVGTVASWVAEQFEKFADSKTPVGELTKAVEDMTATIEFAESMLAMAENHLDNEENIAHWQFMVKVHKEDLGILEQELKTLKDIQNASVPDRIGGTTPTSSGGDSEYASRREAQVQYRRWSQAHRRKTQEENLALERSWVAEGLDRDRANAEASHKIWQENRDRELEDEKAMLEERRNMVAQSLTFANDISSAMSTIHDSRMSELQREFDYEEERIKNSTMSRRKKEDALEALAEKRKKSDIESAKRQVFFASTQGVINVAMAIQNANLAVLGAMAQGQGGAFARIAGGLAVAGATVGAVASVVSASQSIPKREFGGVMRRNELYEVAERNKDEMITQGGKHFTMLSSGGVATPDVKGGGSTVVNMNITFGAGTDTQTIEERLPSMIAKGLEMADRQGDVRYERMSGFQRAIGN